MKKKEKLKVNTKITDLHFDNVVLSENSRVSSNFNLNTVMGGGGSVSKYYYYETNGKFHDEACVTITRGGSSSKSDGLYNCDEGCWVYFNA